MILKNGSVQSLQRKYISKGKQITIQKRNKSIERAGVRWSSNIVFSLHIYLKLLAAAIFLPLHPFSALKMTLPLSLSISLPPCIYHAAIYFSFRSYCLSVLPRKLDVWFLLHMNIGQIFMNKIVPNYYTIRYIYNYYVQDT